jgi:hypothetical protein
LSIIAVALMMAFTFTACGDDDDDLNNGTEKPDAVMNLTATAGNAQVSLAWDEPSENGGEEITGYEVTADNWTNKVTKTANEQTHTYTGLTNGTEYTFKVRAVHANGAGAESSAKATPKASTVSGGVLINGVVWATCNVDAPGTFATTPESAGMFYQWNRKIGWSSSDPMINSNGGTVWDNTWEGGTEWIAANDPSPAGWRVPNGEEMLTLLDEEKVSQEWIDGVNGRRFTDIATGNSIFLPAAGYRAPVVDNLGMLGDVGIFGRYWSSTGAYNGTAVIIQFVSYSYGYTAGANNYGYSVRPVAE